MLNSRSEQAVPGAEGPARGAALEAPGTLLTGGLEWHARATPSRLALEAPGVRWTYAGLAAKARAFAERLRAQGVGRGDRVAVLAPKSAEVVVALYAILGLGATYVPLASDWPRERLRWILRDVRPAALVVQAADAEGWAQGMALPVVPLEPTSSVAAQDTVRDLKPEPAAVTPEQHAYIIYTSGSTGDPKGVVHSHRSALAFVAWAVRELGLRPEDRLASHAPFHFDLSIFDLYAASHAGATLVLPPNELTSAPRRYVAWLREQRISISYSVPGLWTPVLGNGTPPDLAYPELRRIIYAGEPMAPKYVQRLMSTYPKADVYNFYGPTETNVCTSFKIPPLTPETLPEQVPIGTACSGDAIRVEDGELVVSGESLLVGYWGKPPRAAGEPYRTGDLVRWDAGFAAYVFCGRRDGMRKIRGFRVELGEVEACLLRHPAVAEAAAFVDETDPAQPVLVAVIQGVEGAPRDAMLLKRHCASFLPPYMVPRLVWRDSFPRTTTGKTDRSTLLSELSSAVVALES